MGLANILMKSFNLLTFGTAALLGLTAWRQTAAAEDATNNLLTPEEKAAGWQLLFNGKDFSGWHNFHSDRVAPGWKVLGDTLACVNPQMAGDIVTSNQFSWFELQLDYNISDGGNSGILYHVTGEDQPAWPTWYSGPEVQLLDNVATKPVGQWNHVRLLLTPEKCEHDINGVKYFEYVLHSDDFNARVARSKFAQMPPYAKSDTGSIALQGDHGAISFRNIKIRPIQPK